MGGLRSGIRGAEENPFSSCCISVVVLLKSAMYLFTQQVIMLLQGVEHRSISCHSAIRMGDKEDAFLSPGDGAVLSEEGYRPFSWGCERSVRVMT